MAYEKGAKNFVLGIILAVVSVVVFFLGLLQASIIGSVISWVIAGGIMVLGLAALTDKNKIPGVLLIAGGLGFGLLSHWGVIPYLLVIAGVVGTIGGSVMAFLGNKERKRIDY